MSACQAGLLQVKTNEKTRAEEEKLTDCLCVTSLQIEDVGQEKQIIIFKKLKPSGKEAFIMIIICSQVV